MRNITVRNIWGIGSDCSERRWRSAELAVRAVLPVDSVGIWGPFTNHSGLRDNRSPTVQKRETARARGPASSNCFETSPSERAEVRYLRAGTLDSGFSEPPEPHTHMLCGPKASLRVTGRVVGPSPHPGIATFAYHVECLSCARYTCICN